MSRGEPDTVPGALLRAAERQPAATALLSARARLDYADVVACASQVATTLLAAGATTEDRIGVLVRRDLESVVALLGVMLAGAAYVPLDPESPDPRLHHMVDAARVRMLVAPSTSSARADAVARHLPVVATSVGVSDRPGRIRPPHPEDLAYVAFTSGSTGRPKGVEVTHRQLWVATAARFDFPDPGLDLLLLPLMFDAAAGGLYWALCRGGAVLLPEDAEVRSATGLAALARRFPVSHVNATPSLYELLLDALAPHTLADLVYVDVGGEVVSPRLVGRHGRVHPQATLWNCYGPTETTVWATTFRCADWYSLERSVPIGAPVRGYSASVLGPDLGPVREGESGELFVGGPAVARCYSGDPRQTAVRFVPDPDAEVPGGRRYRTGDVVRCHRDRRGRPVLEFQGRRDEMVKVRGHRVELGEVEQVTRQHPWVQEVVVHLPPGARGLQAVVVPAGALEADRLQDWLATRLPGYMVPRVELVDSLPRTPSGKVDRTRVRAERRRDGAPPSPVAGSVGDLAEEQLDALLAGLRGGPSDP